MTSTLKSKFEQLLAETTVFFVAQEASYDPDRELVDRLRTMALDLAVEAQEAPRSFERFVAYVMGLSAMDAHYPLHAIQMMCLAMHLLRDEKMRQEEREELATAAYFADFGFRAAWLSYQSAHTGSAVYHLREFSFPWWTLALERLILFHHEPANDLSPHRMLSFTAQYLAILLGMGAEQAAHDLPSPAKAVQILMEDERFSANSRKRFIERLSAYSLGSWVRLNTGDIGLVIANRSGNPLRPIVGVYQPGQAFGLLKSDSECVEIDLKNEMAHMIAGEALPRAQDRVLFDHPEIWIPRWSKSVAEIISDVEPEAPLPEPEMAVDEVSVPMQMPVVQSPVPENVPDRMPAISNFKGVPSLSPLVESPAPAVETAPLLSDPAAVSRSTMTPTPAAAVAPPSVEEVFPDLTPEEMGTLVSLLIADMEKTLEAREIRLHQESHRCQMETDSLPKAVKRLRHALPEIQSLAGSIAAMGDPDIESVQGILSIWEAELIRGESALRETRSLMTTYLLPWEAKKKEVRGLLENVRRSYETNPALSKTLRLLEHRWKDSLKPEIEKLAVQLIREWDQRAQHLAALRTALHEKADSAVRTKQLLIEKMALTCFAKGLERRREGVLVEAVEQFKKALSLNPQLWEAHVYIGLCHFDTSDHSRIQPRRGNERP